MTLKSQKPQVEKHSNEFYPPKATREKPEVQSLEPEAKPEGQNKTHTRLMTTRSLNFKALNHQIIPNPPSKSLNPIDFRALNAKRPKPLNLGIPVVWA